MLQVDRGAKITVGHRASSSKRICDGKCPGRVTNAARPGALTLRQNSAKVDQATLDLLVRRRLTDTSPTPGAVSFLRVAALPPEADILGALSMSALCHKQTFAEGRACRGCGSNEEPLLINTFNLRRHVRYETNTVIRPLAAQQPHFLIGS